MFFFFFFQAEDGIRDGHVTGVQTCALPISSWLLESMASATENSSSATVSSEPVSAAKAASACRSTSAKEVEEVPRITGPYRVAAWDDSRSSRKRSFARRERSSSLSDS